MRHQLSGRQLSRNAPHRWAMLRNMAASQLRDAEVVVKLFESLGPRFKTRPGGYTQILRMDPRPGDSAPMALMRLMDQPETVGKAGDKPPTQQGETETTSKKAA